VIARRIVDRLTYANVVASIALFVSLGGASYAAFLLPPESVGTNQLQVGAVTPKTLSFPLSARSFTDSKPEDLTKNACNSEPPAGSPASECNTVELPVGEGAPLGRLQLRTRGQLLTTAIVGLVDEGPPGTTVQVELALFANTQAVDRSVVELHGGESVRLPFQGLATAHAGSNSLGFSAFASHYNYSGPGDVIVRSVSIIATGLPAAQP
jgi:hypothetical protein